MVFHRSDAAFDIGIDTAKGRNHLEKTITIARGYIGYPRAPGSQFPKNPPELEKSELYG
jgi:hypothetical protein